VVVGGSHFAVGIDWEPAPGVTSPELQATWARLTLKVDDWILTRSEQDGHAATAVYTSIYPLAEWAAFNWWLLDSNYRPSKILVENRHASSAEVQNSWQAHHRLLAVGDGMAWPDLVLVPVDSENVEASWREHQALGLRFIASGRAILSKAQLKEEFTKTIEAVLEQLKSNDLTSTPLQDEWEAIRSLDEDEVRFCRAAAQLGLDPLSLTDEITELVLSASGKLADELLKDFLLSTTSTKLEQDLEWTMGAIGKVTPDPIREWPQFLDLPDPRKPWSVGYQDAKALRNYLELKHDDVIPLDEISHSTVRDGETSGGIIAVGAPAKDRVEIVSPTKPSKFSVARSIWRARRSEGTFLVSASGGTSSQRAERAFAAELTAPASGLRELIDPHETEQGWISSDRLGELAGHFEISEMVVHHQLRNHFGIDSEQQ